ncbi:subtilase [Clostridium sp. CAG:62]|nr:subtilase [Clostridium sp. CAG:62]
MRVREIMRRSCAVTAMAALVMHHVGPMLNIRAAEPANESGVTGQRTQQKGKKDYIVKFKTKAEMKQSTKTYEESTEINQNGEDKLEENKLVSLELSGKEAEQLETNQNVEFVEEDKEVSACGEKYFAGKDKKKHKKVEKRHKKNESKVEWNVQMIHAENKAKKSNNKVKIAILDSGVDWGNDIDLAYQTSLVPGEEEMTQMFMDGSGHGSSVASLIAAKDNGEGITGINPNAEIYSYRVLGDGNKAPISRVVEAIYMAINHKVNIINMSFGISEYSETLEKAVQDAADAGILVVAAAGNTGSEGVQYPAAYDEVMAVGAVDKDGSVEQYSAKGEELDLVAPGELVRTTGFIGSEEVVSGTSLAAPQVAAAASLIMEKNLNASPEFVRGLLNETANLYGESDAYGSGLLDAEYALAQYDNYSKNYTKINTQNGVEVKVNKRKVETFEDTGCVAGSWTEGAHKKMVEEEYYCVRAGVRFPDLKEKQPTIDYEGKSWNLNLGSNTSDDKYLFYGHKFNPCWHGYYTTNYVKAVLYATYIAEAVYKYNTIARTESSFEYEYAQRMQQSVEHLYDKSQEGWNYILYDLKKNNSKAKKQSNSNGFKRAVIWGMAIHSATDVYAHSTRTRSGDIIHPSTGIKNGADDKEYIKERYDDAATVARRMMLRYSEKKELRVTDLEVPGNYTRNYELNKYSDYMKEVGNEVHYTFDYSNSHGTK